MLPRRLDVCYRELDIGGEKQFVGIRVQVSFRGQLRLMEEEGSPIFFGRVRRRPPECPRISSEESVKAASDGLLKETRRERLIFQAQGWQTIERRLSGCFLVRLRHCPGTYSAKLSLARQKPHYNNKV